MLTDRKLQYIKAALNLLGNWKKQYIMIGEPENNFCETKREKLLTVKVRQFPPHGGIKG